MSDLKATPGPWSYRKDRHEASIIGPNGEDIGYFNAHDGSDEPRLYPVEANARLAVAAHDLYDACELALGAFENNNAIDWGVLAKALAKADGPR